MRFDLGLKQSRYSLNYSFWWMMLIGLPLTAIFIAINSIWGFSWYFNSENWASAVWQEITKARVDPWRKRGAEEVEKDAVAKAIKADRVFLIEPEGMSDGGDFSFVVIGDTGEGDPSQMSLRDQLIAAGQRENVKFLVLSSDVIYPDGKMKDYETNFYLPFKGFEKPIYSIPGNHDWFDADEGFNANFLDHAAAILSLRARLAEDVKTPLITTNKRFDEMVAEAKRLREYYRIRNGRQRAPFFEMHRGGFSLIAIDTGIMRTIDEKERSWLEAALQRLETISSWLCSATRFA
jgi:Calcineurin-like phosphoesterase